ncbi:NBS-LRR type resistance protein [Cucumis melo var. makuwa]|uniref:NBS-LRR type resistance protein n=1 Tax=Cucumis melo var. makuwa TaxID=1194695 RepID=A0A5A7V2J5_CUCMM|nr:NBS-LRR type resistance protein [Cucumis melo var. makuwa]
MAFMHPSFPSSVCSSLGTLHKQSSGSVERTHQSRDPEGCTYQSSDPEGYTYQSSDPKGCTYQSSDPEGCTYQSSDPEGCTYQFAVSCLANDATLLQRGRRRTEGTHDVSETKKMKAEESTGDRLQRRRPTPLCWSEAASVERSLLVRTMAAEKNAEMERRGWRCCRKAGGDDGRLSGEEGRRRREKIEGRGRRDTGV